ncbi:hypothetical protein RA307_27490 [Xanthobacteraceae bacterium Astr-EGSB]|uniref:hypothetical protein n=1 Tax=Astrobacterium formosum TaxID=3069710 RepID=UPI0027B19567|nr:hypothetical protein [Xanthobacteraceae bacterium Astr-EGSB]
MATIANGTGLGTELAKLLRGGAATRAFGTPAQPEQSADATTGDKAATIVHLSDRAKAIVERAKRDQQIADRLDRMFAASGKRGGSRESGETKSLTLEDMVGTSSRDPKEEDAGTGVLAKYGDLPQAGRWAANARADNVGLLQAGTNGFDIRRMESLVRTMNAGREVFLGQENMSEDEQFVQSIQLRLAGEIVSLDDAGMGDKAQALRAAIGNGAVRVQKSSDVPELNLNYSTTHFADAGGGGSRSSWIWNPTGEAKAALDDRHAIAIGGGDRGAFYLSW